MNLFDRKKIGLTKEEYELFKKERILSGCIPNEECTWGTSDGVILSLLDQYDIDEIFDSNQLEHKKAKELFLGVLFCFILKFETNCKYCIGIPLEDRGIDLYVREINFENKIVNLLSLQISEYKEKYSKGENLFSTIEKKLSKYGKGKNLANALLIWIEPNELLRKAELKKCVEMLDDLEGIPFRQILVFGRSKNLFLVSELYLSDKRTGWAMKIDIEKQEVVQKGYLN